MTRSDDADEVLRHVRRDRRAVCAVRSRVTPIALRADDLVALSSALGQDAAQVEARIVELLGCTPREARSLHAEMLRRKLVVPVAGLVAGLAVVTGVGVARRGARARRGAATSPRPAATAGDVAAPTTVARPHPTTVTPTTDDSRFRRPQAPTTRPQHTAVDTGPRRRRPDAPAPAAPAATPEATDAAAPAEPSPAR